MNCIPTTAHAMNFELRFVDLFNAGRGFAFPYDSNRHVDIHDLSQRVRDNYFCDRMLFWNALLRHGGSISTPVPT